MQVLEVKSHAGLDPALSLLDGLLDWQGEADDAPARLLQQHRSHRAVDPARHSEDGGGDTRLAPVIDELLDQPVSHRSKIVRRKEKAGVGLLAQSGIEPRRQPTARGLPGEIENFVEVLHWRVLS